MSSSRLPLGGARPEPRAVLYLSYARLLGFPAEGLERSVRDGTLAAEMAGLHRAAGLPGAPWAVRPGRGEGLEQAYIAAFDAGVPEPPVPLYESAYLAEDAARRRGLLEDLVRFYEFFDLDLGESPSEAPDHLAVELEFLAAVAQLESLADARGGDGAPFRRAQRDFLDRHLLGFVEQICRRTLPEGFYRGAFHALMRVSREDRGRAAWAVPDAEGEGIVRG